MSDPLKPLFSALADESRAAGTPERVHAELISELAARRRRRWLWRWAPLAAVAAALVVAVVLWRCPELPPPPAVAFAPPPAPPLEAEDRVVTPPPVRPVRRAAPRCFVYSGLPPQVQGQLVNLEVSNATAASFGVITARQRVSAQVFIGYDGMARAICFTR